MAFTAISAKLYAGDFEDAVTYAEDYFKGGEFRQAVSIIRKVCDIVVKKQGLSQAQTQSIKRMCCLCLQVMIREKVGDVIEVDQKLTASLFHIAKVIGENDAEAFADLIWASLPVLESMPKAEDKQFLTIVQLSSLVALNITKLLDTLSKNNIANIESQLQNYLVMVLRVFNLTKKDFSVGFSVAQKIIVFYSEKVKSAKQSEEFVAKIISSLNQSFLDIANNGLDPDLNNFYFKSLMAAVKTLRSIFSMDEHELAFKIWKEMINALKAVMPTFSTERKALNVIDKSLNPFLFSVNSIPSSIKPFTDLQEALLLMKEATVENNVGSKAFEQAAWAISYVLWFLTNDWCRNISEYTSFFPLVSLSDLEELITELVRVLRRGNCYVCCNQPKKCLSKGDIYYAFQLELGLLFLCAWIINWNTDSRPLLLKVCENSFSLCDELLLEGTGKNCLKSVDFYSMLCERACTIAQRNIDNPKLCVKLAERAKEWSIQYIKANGGPPPFAARTKKLMKILALKRRELDEASSACEAIAVALLIECQYSEQVGDKIDSDLSKMWSDVVSYFPNEYVPLLTLLRTNKTVKDFFGDSNDWAYDPTQLFIWETMALGYRNFQQFSVFLKHWNTRKGLNFSPLQKIKSDAYFLSALSFCADLENVQEFIASFKTKEYEELLKIIPSGDRPVALCALAQLLYSRFFIDKRIYQESCKKRVEEAKSVKPLNKIVLSAEDVVNENDACDLTPTYVDLNVSKEVSLLNILDAALGYWDESLKKGLEASQLLCQELRLFADCLINAAMHYRLSGHYLKEKQAWVVCRSFGLQTRNDQLTLQALSGLMEMGCCDAGWVQRAKAIAASLANEPTAKTVLHIYKNSYVVYCFSHNKVEEGAALLKEVLKSEDEPSWLHFKSEFLLATIMSETPDRLRMSLFSEQDGDGLRMARDCYGEISYLIKRVKTKGDVMLWSNRTEHASVVDLLFAIALWLGYMYLKMMQPREARCFLKLHLLVVQKMGLSARTAECLSLLGTVDILVEKIEDGVVRVEGLKQILEIEPAKKQVADEIPVPVYRDEEAMDRLRVAPPLGNQTGASPELPIVRYAMPEFVSHKSTCGCYYCSHILIHSLWLDVGFIQAEVFSLQCKIRAARNFFQDAIKLADACRRKHDKLLDEFSVRALVLEDFIRSETMLRLKFADLLIVNGTVKEAWEINESLSAFLDKTQLRNALLRTYVGEQRITLIDIRNIQALTQVPKQQLQVNSTTAEVTPTMSKARNIGGLKTPLPTSLLGARSRTPLEPIAAQNVIPIKEKTFVKGRGVLPIAFHLSDSDEETAEEKGAKPVRTSKAKSKGKEDRVKEREKKAKPCGKSTKGKEAKTNSKSESAVNSAAVSVNPDNVIPISDPEDSVIQVTDSDDDVQVLSRLVSPGFQASRTSKMVRETLGKVKLDQSDDVVDVSSRKVKATRSKEGTSSAEAEKAKSRRCVPASGKNSQCSIPVRITRSRRFL